ncbi:MarR family transcriptional regulator [Clavibacter lycopersici]|uniref:MarR family transcriptional regulator n=1 Tax=Clavibacter lycopersici TaxID=2301718 RepID=A0A399TDJ3_9MICO|nr:MarR family transcriptional regulator [Clavibacter lycopersici]RIJ52191.1 MarR family transcriptional regulator [Clavibacter lycopersici]RIJ61066.1 MarR family transcriptional regulator [Clavibacter lycopersici]
MGSARIDDSIGSTAREPSPDEREGGDERDVRGATAGDPSTRFAHAVALLASIIDEETATRWDGLTGLQVLFLTRIRRAGHVTRTDLLRGCLTSRAAGSPGLSSLLQRGYLVETWDGAESVLTMGPAGRDVCERVERARAQWVRRAMAADPSGVCGDDLRRSAEVIERLAAAVGDPVGGARQPEPGPR